APGQAVLGVILVQELGLETGHVHVRRTLALARLALQAEVEYVEQSRIGQAAQVALAGQRQPQRVGPAARAVLFLRRRPIRRTHGAAAFLAALADAGTQFGGAGQAAVGREVERRRHLRSLRV